MIHSSTSSSSSLTSSLPYTLPKRPSGRVTNNTEYMDFLHRNRNYTCYIDDIPSIFTFDDVRYWTMPYGSILDIFDLKGRTTVQKFLHPPSSSLLANPSLSSSTTEENNPNDYYETWTAGVKFFSQQAATLAKRALHNKKPWEQKEFVSLYFPTEIFSPQPQPSRDVEPQESTVHTVPAIHTGGDTNTIVSIPPKDTSGNSLLSSSVEEETHSPLFISTVALPSVHVPNVLPEDVTGMDEAYTGGGESHPFHSSVIQTAYVPLRTWIGKPLRIDEQRDEHYEPLKVNEIIDLLNSYAPLQWSNSIEICDIHRRCKKKEAPKPLSSIETLLDDHTLTTEERLELIHQMFPSLTVPLITLSSASDDASTSSNNNETYPPSAVPLSSGIPSFEPNVDPLSMMNDEETYDDEDTSFDAGSSSFGASSARKLKSVHPTTLARETLIHENIMNNPGLGCTSLNDIAKDHHLGHTLCSPMQPLRSIPLIDSKFISIPHPHKPGTYTRPCVFVRQSVIFHNKDGTDVTSTAAGGCSCRHRNDNLAVSSANVVPKTDTNDSSSLENIDLRQSHVKMYVVPPPAKPINQTIQLNAPMVSLNPNTVPFSTLPNLLTVTSEYIPPKVSATYENYDDTLLPLSQQFSQVGPEPAVKVPSTSSSTVLSSTSSSSSLISTLSAAIKQATSSSVSVSSESENALTRPHRLRLRGSQKRQPWTGSDITKGKPIKLASTEAFRMATARLCLQLSKPAPPITNNGSPVDPSLSTVQTGRKLKRSF